ncbi:hypothetical protein A2U01_0110365, partial [Trifolium medium]|nr:hypothetical protein [Trifolium medium]
NETKQQISLLQARSSELVAQQSSAITQEHARSLQLAQRPLKNMHACCRSLQGSLSDHALL